jgi:F-type H+-transporting ATPase subunit delta
VRDETVAKNYAETLFELARRYNSLDEYGEAIGMVAGLVDQNPKFRAFLETPRIDDDDKKAVIKTAFGGKVPQHVLNFVMVTIDKRRQRLLRAISTSYDMLVDEHVGREHVEVTVARPIDDATTEMIAERLTRVLGKKAIPHIRVRSEILGGLVVRTSDMIYDGSIRRRLDGIRRRMLQAKMPKGSSAAADA